MCVRSIHLVCICSSVFLSVVFRSPECVDAKNEVAFVVCTSGTTGLSKGVCMTHESALYASETLVLVNIDDRIFCFSSLYWLSGVMFLLLGTLRNATRVITTEKYSPDLFLELIEKYRISLIFTSAYQLIVATKADSIKHRDLSSVRIMISGGSKVPYDATLQCNRYMRNGSVCVGYGMSEAAGCISVNYPYVDSDTVGRLVPGAQIKIVDDDGVRLGINQEGELCLKTFFKFPGYFGNAEATRASFDQEGFFKTGDIGRFDENGHLYIVDRKKDFIRYRGATISPSDVESFFIECPGIQSVCITSVDDYESGDLPAAAIILKDGATIDETDICKMVEGKFSDSKKLRGGVYFVKSLPMTPSGKVVRRQVKLLVNELYKVKNGTQTSTNL